MNIKLCVCVCVCVYTHIQTNTHTHTHINEFRSIFFIQDKMPIYNAWKKYTIDHL